MIDILLYNAIGPFLYYLLMQLFGLSESKRKKVFLVLLFLQIFIFQSFFDYGDLPDIPFYNDYFYYLHNHSISSFYLDYGNRIEIGFIAFVKFVAFFFSNDRALYVVRGLVVAGCVIYFISKHSKDYLWASVLYVLVWGGLPSVIVVRQYLAMAIFLLAIDAVIERKLIMFLIISVISISLHTSTFIFLPLYFLCGMRINQKNVTILIILMIILGFILRKYMVYFTPSEMYYNYVKNSDLEKAASIGPLIRSLTLFIPFLVVCSKKIEVESHGKLIFVILILNMLFSSIIIGITAGARLFVNYASLSIIAVPYTASYIKNSIVRYIYLWTIILFFSILTFRQEHVFEYHFMW